MIQHHRISSGTADAAISRAAAELLASSDEGQDLEAGCMRLARALFRAGRLEGQDLARILEEGQLPLFLAGIRCAVRIDHGSAWEILSDPEGRGSALLLRAGRVDRDAAAWILLMLNSRGRLFSGTEGEAAAAQLDMFDTMTEAEALEIIRLWQVDPGYRAAIARLSTRQRSAAA